MPWHIVLSKDLAQSLSSSAPIRESAVFAPGIPYPRERSLCPRQPLSVRAQSLSPPALSEGAQYLSLPPPPRLLTIYKKSSQRASNSNVLDKERCIKKHIFFELFCVSCIYLTI